jgi:hypothetical protein
VRVPLEGLPQWRRQPGPVVGEPLPSGFLKHADEQTVAGLAAVYQAIHDHGLPADGFRDWGVLAAPRFLGRPAMALALQRFAAEGAWGVSPHLIPHRSLHSVSGTVSQALKVHGPNFGVGGGPGSEAEALLGAAALLERRRLPGVWVVLTRLDPEQPLDPEGRPAAGTTCLALALALVPPRAGWQGVRVRIVAGVRDGPSPCTCSCGGECLPGLDLLRLEALLAGLEEAGRGEAALLPYGGPPLDGAGWIELSRPRAPGTGSSRQPSTPTTQHAPRYHLLLPIQHLGSQPCAVSKDGRSAP